MANDEGIHFLEPREKYDRAIIGLMEYDSVVCYDAGQVIEITAELHDLDYEQAVEFYDFNIAGSLFDGCPVYCATDYFGEYNEKDSNKTNS